MIVEKRYHPTRTPSTRRVGEPVHAVAVSLDLGGDVSSGSRLGFRAPALRRPAPARRPAPVRRRTQASWIPDLAFKLGNTAPQIFQLAWVRRGTGAGRRAGAGRRRLGREPQPRSGRYVTAQIQRNGHRACSVNRLTHPARRWRPSGGNSAFPRSYMALFRNYIRNRGSR
jgi:hypothetical protein